MEHHATYSPDDNKLRLYPAYRLDSEEYARVKSAGFKWAPRQELFVAPMWTPGREDLLLEMCGEIEDEDTSLLDRAEERGERFEQYSANRLRDAEQAKQAVSAIAEGIPLGQPILVGHHSEKRARKDAEKIQRGMERAVKAWKTSQYWTDRAAGALYHAKYKELPAVRHRRIKKIESDKRKSEKNIKDAQAKLKGWQRVADEQDAEKQRAMALELANFCHATMPRKDGDNPDFPHTPTVYGAIRGDYPNLYAPRTIQEVLDYLLPMYPRMIAREERWVEHYNNRLAYERAMLGETTGAEDLRERWDIKKGGRVLIGNEWVTVLRVNKSNGKVNSVTVQAPASIRWRDTCKYGIEKVKDYREPTAEDKAAAEKATAKPPLCNYPGEGFEHMTKAEWSKVYKDWKGYREVEASEQYGAHRTRYRVRLGGGQYGRVGVYITDQKRTDPPAAALAPQEAEQPLQREFSSMPDPRPVLNIAEDRSDFDAMEKALKSGTAVQAVSAPQLFPTPPELARRMVQLAGEMAGKRVLEPSAGTGSLVRAIQNAATGADCVRVVAIEKSYDLAQQLEQMRNKTLYATPHNFHVINEDFLGIEPESGDIGTFHAVIMNPPFEKGQDIEHVQHAARFLRPGGVLVAVMCAGPFFRQDRQSTEFRDWLDDQDSETIDLPPDSFKASGTGVNTKLVVIRASEQAAENAA